MGCHGFLEARKSGSPGTWEHPRELPLPPQPGGMGVSPRQVCPQGDARLWGAVCPCVPFMVEAGLGSAGKRRGRSGRRKRGGRPAWVEESPNRLKIAREIIPTPSQNRKQPPRPTKGQGSWGWGLCRGKVASVTASPTPKAISPPQALSPSTVLPRAGCALILGSGGGDAQEGWGPSKVDLPTPNPPLRSWPNGC